MSEARLLSRPAPLPVQEGAYAVIVDEAGRVLVVEGATGRCYLPGGRIEPGETPQQSLIREIAEECGCSADIVRPLVRAEQRIFDGAVRLQATYWEARLTGRLPRRPEHRCTWLGPAAALSCLHRPGERQAVRAALQIQGWEMVPRGGIEPPTP